MTGIMETALSNMYRDANFPSALDTLKTAGFEELRKGFTAVFSDGTLRVEDDVLEGMCALHFFDGNESLGTTGFVSEEEMMLFKGSFIALIGSFIETDEKPAPEYIKAFSLEFYKYQQEGTPERYILIEFAKETFEIFCQAL